MMLQLKEVEGYEPGQQLNPDELFKVGEMVDVAGTTVGKGFQGELPSSTLSPMAVAHAGVSKMHLTA